MISCYIEGRNLRNGIEERYLIAEGATFTDNYNETLDSATILLSHLPNEIEIEPYDVVVVEITGESKPRRLCVDTYECREIMLNPRIFNYEISLFSETKILETIALPSLKITKMPGIYRTVYDYLEWYVDQYSPKKSFDSETGEYENKLSLNEEALAKFKTIQCPEMQWNQPTLREVLNDLMMVGDCIAVLYDNKIGCIDISQIGSEIGDEQKAFINYKTKSRSSEDYVSELKTHIVNAANNETIENPTKATRVVEKIGFRNNESYLLTTQNLTLQTSFPIWKIFHCYMYVPVPVITFSARHGVWEGQLTLTNVDLGYKSMDLSPYILEKSEWMTKNVYYGAWSVEEVGLSTEYRNTCLYFTRGSKNILNFNEYAEGQLLWVKNVTFVLDMILKSIYFNEEDVIAYVNKLMENLSESSGEEWTWYPNSLQYTNRPESVVGEYKNVKFELSYEPISDFVFTASKSPMPRHRRMVIDNQTNSYVDVERQGFLQYLKANRLGNEISMANGRYLFAGSDIPQLSQKIDSKIIFSRQLAMYSHHVDANLTTVSDYVLRDYFTRVKSKLRSWRIIDGSEALTRCELIKLYINENIPSINSEYCKIPSYQNLDRYIEEFKYCAVLFNTENEGTFPKPRGFMGSAYHSNILMVEFTRYRSGNSIVFSFNLGDNNYAGNYVSNYGGTGGAEQKGIGYTDSNGEITGGTIYFYNRIRDVSEMDPIDNVYEFEAIEALKPMVFAELGAVYAGQAILEDSAMVARIPFKMRKDSGEIPQISIQFELNADADDMFLGSKRFV